MKKKKYLLLYYKWMKNGKMPNNGLCASLNHDKKMEELLCPDNEDSVTCAAYWGWNGEKRTRDYGFKYVHDTSEITRKFTPLRQNIVLFLAAMNDEL